MIWWCRPHTFHIVEDDQAAAMACMRRPGARPLPHSKRGTKRDHWERYYSAAAMPGFNDRVIGERL